VSGLTISTERLVLRRWLERDRAPFAAMNGDPEVMAHFPEASQPGGERRLR
jgi:RimJ/RimL family protein N-acetyltransferase